MRSVAMVAEAFVKGAWGVPLRDQIMYYAVWAPEAEIAVWKSR